MTVAEMPPPPDKPKDLPVPKEPVNITSGPLAGIHEAIAGLEDPIELPITNEEVSRYAQYLAELDEARATICEVVCDRFAYPDMQHIDELERRAVAMKKQYHVALSKLIAEVVLQSESNETLLQELTTILYNNLSDINEYFAALSDKYDSTELITKEKIKSFVEDLLDTYLHESTPRSASAIVDVLVEGQMAELNELFEQIFDCAPDLEDAEGEIAAELRRERAKDALIGLGKAAGQAITIAVGIAAGSIIADRVKRR